MSQQPLTAARFEITIDGHSLGRFEMLMAATAAGAAPRALEVHELPLLVQYTKDSQSSTGTPWEHNFEMRPGKFARSDHAFAAPAGNSHSQWSRWGDVTLKRGICSQALIERWQLLSSGDIILVGLSPTGQPVARYHLTNAWPRKYSPAQTQPVNNWKLTPAWPSKYSSATDVLAAGRLKVAGPTLPGKGGADVAIEEIVIAHEGVRLD